MNRRVTRSFATVAFLVFTASLTSLMAQSEEQIQRFKKEREAFFTEKLELTKSEADAFWPVYNDFHNRKMKIVEEERNAFKYAHKNSGNLSDEEINEILGKIRTLKQEQFKLETDYYQRKFPTVLSPEKVLKLYKVEWDFRGHLIRQLRGQGHGARGSKGGKPGSGPGSGPGQGSSQDSECPPPIPLF